MWQVNSSKILKPFLRKRNNITYLDGGIGTLLQNAGLKPGELPEMIWRIRLKRPAGIP